MDKMTVTRLKLSIAVLLSTVILNSALYGTDAPRQYEYAQKVNVSSTEVNIHIEEETTEPVEQTTEASKKYYSTNITEELQEYIFKRCERYSISPALVFSIIERESNCDSEAVGDGGKSLGIMQIQPRWHQWRMDELGCNDWMNPYDNVTVGIDILADLFQKYGDDVYMVLMAYNGGETYAEKKALQGIVSDYAIEVDKRAAELEELYANCDIARKE